ncbi:MAG: hypothetical protein NWS20_02625 [Rickettsiaceae bacterium]|nr:hypothetical protein [Rickettsiaceae bacterium]MDP4832527.1 hypothetical protein [Rickettsiaceae bacterium]MDP5020231.1 hypothetical protein [Rickettsiaceae bacterium]MDP5083500.1 hypothetical protein [Rickettsiaceae bacterium]
MGVNYLGGGVTNIDKPAQHYQIIDERNKVTKANTVTGAKKFDSVLKKIQTKNVSNSTAKELVNSSKSKVSILAHQSSKSSVKSDGTDIALKRLSKEMENQLYGMFWTMIDSARDADHEGGFAEKLFRGPYLTEVVKTSSDAELGEIGEAIYRSLVENKSQKGKK